MTGQAASRKGHDSHSANIDIAVPDYFDEPDADQQSAIRFFQFSTNNGLAYREALRPRGGMTVSPDQKTFLGPQDEGADADLFMIENFK